MYINRIGGKSTEKKWIEKEKGKHRQKKIEQKKNGDTEKRAQME